MTEQISSASGLQTGAVVQLDGSLKSASPADVYIQKIAEHSNHQPEYIGFSEPSNNAGSSTWQIRKLSYDGNFLTDVTFAGSSLAFNKVWDDRATYSYG